MHYLLLWSSKGAGILTSTGWGPAVNITRTRKTDDILKELHHSPDEHFMRHGIYLYLFIYKDKSLQALKAKKPAENWLSFWDHLQWGKQTQIYHFIKLVSVSCLIKFPSGPLLLLLKLFGWSLWPNIMGEKWWKSFKLCSAFEMPSSQSAWVYLPVLGLFSQPCQTKSPFSYSSQFPYGFLSSPLWRFCSQASLFSH